MNTTDFVIQIEKFKIEHDRPGCIACGACAAVAPQFWDMSPYDGKSDLKNSKKILEGDEIVKEEMTIDDKDFELNMVAAESCPVNVIHLVNKEENKKLI